MAAVSLTQTLPELFPVLAKLLTSLGLSAPTPIQAALAAMLLNKEGAAATANQNLMLISPTGLGKSAAYLLPALTKAIQEKGKILVVVPT